MLPRGRGRADTRWDRPRFFSANREDGQGPRAPQGRASATAPTATAPAAPGAPRAPAEPSRPDSGRRVIGSHGPQRAPCDLIVGRTHLGPSRLQMQETLSARMGSGGRICEKPAGSLRGGTDRQGRFTPNPYAATKPPSPGVRTCPLGCVREEGEGKHSRRACLCTCVPYSVCMCASSRTHLYLYRVCVHD